MSTPGTPTVRRRALSLIEAVISILIIGTMLVAALNTVGAARMGEAFITDGTRARLLALALMSEILEHPYQEAGVPDAIGLDAGESSTTRTDFDDVDDYDSWDQLPPRTRGGGPIPNAGGFRRRVDIRWVDPTDLNNTSGGGGSTGIKRIEVSVEREGTRPVVLTAYRTKARPDAVIDPNASN